MILVNKVNVYEPGGIINLRISKDYSKEDLKPLNDLRKRLGRKFNSYMISTLIQAVNKSEKEVTIELPSLLTTEQLERFQNADVQRIIGSIVYSLLSSNDPIPLTMFQPHTVVKEEEEPKQDDTAVNDYFKNNNMLNDL